jgi:hypothetical protein
MSSSPPPDDPKAAIMPAQYRKPQHQSVSDLAIGDEAYISWAEVHVNSNGRTYIAKDTKLRDDRGWAVVKVRRETNGFIVWLKKETGPYTERRLYASTGYLPVIQILFEEPGAEKVQ